MDKLEASYEAYWGRAPITADQAIHFGIFRQLEEINFNLKTIAVLLSNAEFVDDEDSITRAINHIKDCLNKELEDKQIG